MHNPSLSDIVADLASEMELGSSEAFDLVLGSTDEDFDDDVA